MWAKACLGLHVALLLQGLATCFPENDLSSSAGGNIVLDPDTPSVLATLERLQREHDRLKQDFQQSNSQLMALVQDLQKENSQLRQQQSEVQSMVSGLLSEMGEKMRENLEQVNDQVQSQVSGLLKIVNEMKGHQEAVMRQEAMMQGVLDVVQEFEDESHNVTSLLAQLQARLASAEASLLQLEVEGCGCVDQLAAVQRRVDQFESQLRSLQAGRSTFRPSSSPPTPSPSSTTMAPVTWGLHTSSSSPQQYTTDSAVPRLVFSVPPNDMLGENSLITSILVTKEGKLLTGDLFLNELKMSSLESPRLVEDTYSLHKPWSILQVQDGTIAVTMREERRILFFSIAGDSLELERSIRTMEDYYGIAEGPANTLIVSTMKTGFDSTRIDVINMHGEVQRTLLNDVDFLVDPQYLRRFGDDVYVSDWTSRHVFRVNVYTGEVKFTVGNLDLSDLSFYQPREFDIDGNGNLYIATGGRVCNPHSDGYFCIIQVTQTGSWKVMDKYIGQHSGIYPYGLELTSSQIIISWGNWDYVWTSELTSYTLPEPEAVIPATTETPPKKSCGHGSHRTTTPEGGKENSEYRPKSTTGFVRSTGSTSPSSPESTESTPTPPSSSTETTESTSESTPTPPSSSLETTESTSESTPTPPSSSPETTESTSESTPTPPSSSPETTESTSESTPTPPSSSPESTESTPGSTSSFPSSSPESTESAWDSYDYDYYSYEK